MKFETYTELTTQISSGKRLPGAVYLHKSALEELPDQLYQFALNIVKAVKVPDQDWNIIKFSTKNFRLSLLNYPSFEVEPYPPLKHSWTVDLSRLGLKKMDYSSSENPPILHRRETFLADGHPQKEVFATYTQEGEEVGLYENTRTIGTQQGWNRLIKRKGYYLDEGGHLAPLSDRIREIPKQTQFGKIERHKAAISRDTLSLPLFLIAQRGYLDGNYSVLDYGCGKGDDLKELEANDITCMGWDPAYRPDVDLQDCDIVNLGYVINVIEDREERGQTLQHAYSLATKFLVVSAMLGNESIFEKYKPFKDGVITKINTFQKYYMQGELRQYIESTLSEEAIALAPGIFAIFKDKLEQQNYLLKRQKAKREWKQLTARPKQLLSKREAKTKYEKNKELFEDFWTTCLDLGRLPADDEFEFTDAIRHIQGSSVKAFDLCKQIFGEEEFIVSKRHRKEDLLVYFALSFFNKRREVFSRMPLSLQRDIKQFFGKYSIARDLGKEVLFSVANVDVIYETCIEAHQVLPASELNGQHDLVFHKDFLGICPLELRVYVGCAIQLYGELEEVSLIKAHILSGKVSLMVYDDWSKDVPLLTERIKIKMREQDIDFFDYVGEYEPQPLSNKDAFL